MRPVICCSCGGRRWPGTGGEAQALLSRVGPSLNAGRKSPPDSGPRPVTPEQGPCRGCPGLPSGGPRVCTPRPPGARQRPPPGEEPPGLVAPSPASRQSGRFSVISTHARAAGPCPRPHAGAVDRPQHGPEGRQHRPHRLSRGRPVVATAGDVTLATSTGGDRARPEAARPSVAPLRPCRVPGRQHLRGRERRVLVSRARLAPRAGTELAPAERVGAAPAAGARVGAIPGSAPEDRPRGAHGA